MKYPLSLMIITLNEERNIERCIRSVPFASEILVIDSGSADRTCEIAASLGARVLQKEWLGFGAQKRWGSLQAKEDWILSLDADEALSPELAAEIQNGFSSLAEKTGYEIPRRSFHLGKWIDHGGWYPDYQLRLYNRRFSNWPEASIHERVVAPHEKKLNHPIFHYVFENLAAQVETNNRYSGLLAEKDFAAGKRFHLLRLVVKPWTKFMETYFLKKGFLDGLPGFMISVSAAYSIFLRQAKLWEIQMKKQKGIQK
ncbi:MAG: glycosyltransferase family 2 protein [Pseudobdellovibrionaceae bacterium]